MFGMTHTATLAPFGHLTGFFFQAEDGIRGHCVTGVQTCALPIWRGAWNGRRSGLHFPRRAADGEDAAPWQGSRLGGRSHLPREVLGLGRGPRHPRGGGSTDRRSRVRPGVPAAHDGVPVLPGPHPGRAECSERRHDPNSNWLLARRQAGSKEPQPTMLMVLVLGLSVLALAVAWGLRGYVLRQDNGTPDMRKISDAIQEGAEAFLRRQYRTIGTLSIALGVVIYVLYAFFRKPHADEPAAATLALTTTLSFVFGALCSGVAGIVGMYVAVRSNIRTASAARP